MNKILALVMAVVAAATFGCGKSQTYESRDGKLKVDKKGDAVQYEMQTKEGKTTVTASDKGVAIPDTFPKDVPILKGAVPKMTASQGKTELLQLHVPASVADAAKEYQAKLKAEGWEIENTMNLGETSMVQAKKDKRTCAVVVAKDGNESTVQLSVTQQ